MAYQKGNTLVIQSTSNNESDAVTLVGDDWEKLDSVVSVGGQGSFSVYQHGSSNIHVVIDDNIAHGLAA